MLIRHYSVGGHEKAPPLSAPHFGMKSGIKVWKLVFPFRLATDFLFPSKAQHRINKHHESFLTGKLFVNYFGNLAFLWCVRSGVNFHRLGLKAFQFPLECEIGFKLFLTRDVDKISVDSDLAGDEKLHINS